MAKLLIVESPGKLKTLRQILGRDWILEASVGHTTELASDGARRLGFEITETGVITRYVPRGSRGKGVLAKLRQAVKKAEKVYLASDPDREGEAIAWHLVQQLGLKNYCRVSYTQITEAAVRKAVAHPGSIDLALVQSQRARQCLDKLVGFAVSPLLWSSTGGKSAGRVQSSTLHLICERERERLAFKPEQYWTLKSSYGEGFDANYEAAEGQPVGTSAEAKRVETIARANPHIVKSLETQSELRNPPPPLITSSLQQMAGARLRYSPKKTMQVAQELYEGVQGKGLITYMRTDAVTLSPEFVAEARDWLKSHSPESLAERAPAFRVKADAQGSHEAIRPTSVSLTPEAAARILSREQLEIYRLIWERSIASQCKPALLSKAKITVACQDTRWVARGMTVLDLGYLKFWKNTEEERILPKLAEGVRVNFRDVEVEERVTEPPSRYTEPKLVQLMEKRGIGRPSTYASTIATLKDRDYAVLEKNFLVPTSLGMATDEALTRAMPDLVNTEFTARMEQALDQIGEGKLAWERYLLEWNRGYLEPAVAAARQILGTATHSARQGKGPGAKRSKGVKARGKGRGTSLARAPARAVQDPQKIAQALGVARDAGPLPICASGHGDLRLKMSKKGGFYWRCEKIGCENFAWYQDLSDEKCPECSLALERIPSSKVTGGYFLKCARKDQHPAEVVLFRDRATQKWERPVYF